MKTISYTLFTLFLALSLSLNCLGQEITLTQSNNSGIYDLGEKIKVSVELTDIQCDSIHVKILENKIKELKNESIPLSEAKFILYEGVYSESTSLIFEVSVGEINSSTGLVVDPGNFEPGTERPKDFNKYWKAEKKALRTLEMKVSKSKLEGIEEGYSCYDMKISCTGPKAARGYYAKPDNAEKKSLPIVLLVHAAGVKGSWCLSNVENTLRYAKMGNGALCFDLNAHGMLNGQPQEYYDKLEEGELKGYYHQGIEEREEFYFRGMYLRLIRTLDFLCKQEEWDGKRIIVIGESQGGGQALAAAGLDKRVTAAVAIVPAMCDWGGSFVGRGAGWPMPFNLEADKDKMMNTLPYFDAAHLLKNSKATIFTEIGFIDYTCPSTSVYAAINQSKGEKIIMNVPYRGHHLNQQEFKALWEKEVYKPRMEFIKKFIE